MRERRRSQGGAAGRLARGAVAAAALLAAWPPGVGGLAPGAARAEEAPVEEAWKGEFADVCSRTQDAMTLSDAELKGLVQRCDALKPRVEALGEPLRKVYLRRLQVCRELYQFVLDSRAAGAAR